MKKVSFSPKIKIKKISDISHKEHINEIKNPKYGIVNLVNDLSTSKKSNILKLPKSTILNTPKTIDKTLNIEHSLENGNEVVENDDNSYIWNLIKWLLIFFIISFFLYTLVNLSFYKSKDTTVAEDVDVKKN